MGRTAATDVDVVLVHGWACPPSYWAPLRAELERRGRRARIAILPGYDGAWRGTADDWTTARAAESLAAGLRGDAPEGRRAVVVGHSLGGTVAAQLAATHAELVAGLVLVGMVPVAPAEGTRRRLTELFGGLGLTPPVRPTASAIEACLAAWYGAASGDPRGRPADVEAIFDLPPAVLYGSLMAALDGTAPEVPDRIMAPAAVVLGAEDRTRDAREVAAFMEWHRAWHLESVEGAGHMVHWERPDVCADVVTQLG